MRLPDRLKLLRSSLVLASIVGLLLGGLILYREVGRPDPETVTPAYGAVVLDAPTRDSALFVGDDFPAGYGGIGRNAYPQIVCHSIGLNCGVDAQPGTGFVNDGREYSPTTFALGDRLPTDQKLYDPKLVIIDAGRNDDGAEEPVLAKAATQYFQQIKRMWPAARLVVIAPYYLSSRPDEDYGSRISLLRPIVAAQNGTLIDPAAEGWYEGVDESAMLLSDGLHPNQAGQEFIAKKLAKSLRDRGIGQSGAVS